MRKINPGAVRAEFQVGADGLLAFMDRACRALRGGPGEKQDISQLASMVFLSLYVSFERFLSDLFLAYLNRDFSRYQQDLEGRLLQSVNDKLGPWAGSRSRFERVRHVKVDDLKNIVDPNGWNLTFKDAATIKAKADQWLSGAHRGRIHSLTIHDDRLIDTARAVRDFIAHQSPGAKRRMNDLLQTVAQGRHNRHLDRAGNEVHNAGLSQGCFRRATPSGYLR